MVNEKRVFSPHSVHDLVAGWLVHAHKARDRHELAARTYARGPVRARYPGAHRLDGCIALTDEQLTDLQAQLDALEESAPVVMPKIYDRVEARYQNLKYVQDALDLYKP